MDSGLKKIYQVLWNIKKKEESEREREREREKERERENKREIKRMKYRSYSNTQLQRKTE